MLPQIADAFARHVAASEAILAADGDIAAHDERVAALDAILFGDGLDLGQVSRPAQPGVPNHQQRPSPGRDRDQVSPQCLAWLRSRGVA